MAGHGHGKGRKRRGGHGGGEHGSDERWLLTYADMITLLMALFMVLFSISSVNISKYQVLQKSLKSAFSGGVLSGGKDILQSGSTNAPGTHPPTTIIPAIVAPTQSQAKQVLPTVNPQQAQAATVFNKSVAQAMSIAAAAHREQNELLRLKARLDLWAKEHGVSKYVRTLIDPRGLVIRILTDKVLFSSGSAQLQPQSLALLDELAKLLNVDQLHPITVAGHTDNQPISTAEFPSNWELSSARATNVVEFLIRHGVEAQRLSATGYAYLHPVASNATPQGRALNRRVEIILQRINPDLTP
jgi:chemotaxis protein MotB